jgi:hypothetical protein
MKQNKVRKKVCLSPGHLDEHGTKTAICWALALAVATIDSFGDRRSSTVISNYRDHMVALFLENFDEQSREWAMHVVEAATGHAPDMTDWHAAWKVFCAEMEAQGWRLGRARYVVEIALAAVLLWVDYAIRRPSQVMTWSGAHASSANHRLCAL